MAAQTSEQSLVIEAMQGRIETPTVLVQSEDQKVHQAPPDQRESKLSSFIISKVLAGLAKQLASVYVSISNPPSTERGPIRNASISAKHDRFISFLR